jgi:hypothetical protein
MRAGDQKLMINLEGPNNIILMMNILLYTVEFLIKRILPGAGTHYVTDNCYGTD